MLIGKTRPEIELELLGIKEGQQRVSGAA